MKKMLITCGVLCMTLLLFCGTALAKTEVKPGDDASVTVTVNEQEVTVKKDSGAEADQLYLVMIQKGAASEKPTEANLYYLDVDKATGASFEKKAYPKDLEAGEYAVFLSDYSGTNNGARKLVATLTVSADSDGLKLGDVNDDTYIDASDAYLVMRIFSGMAKDNAGTINWSAEELKAANVDNSEYIDASDALLIMQHFAGLLDDNFKRK